MADSVEILSRVWNQENFDDAVKSPPPVGCKIGGISRLQSKSKMTNSLCNQSKATRFQHMLLGLYK